VVLLDGGGVDTVTGAQYNLTPSTISVRLDESDGSVISASEDSAAEGIRRLNDLDQLYENNQISDEEFALGRKAIIEEYFPELIPETQDNPS